VIQNNLEGIQNYIAANKDLSVRDENVIIELLFRLVETIYYNNYYYYYYLGIISIASCGG
jgi:hypothetical protein